MSLGVAIPGCERTAGRITACPKVVNRTLGFLDQIPKFFWEDVSARANIHIIVIGSTSIASSMPCGTALWAATPLVNIKSGREVGQRN
jgi:hypothetical protein